MLARLMREGNNKARACDVKTAIEAVMLLLINDSIRMITMFPPMRILHGRQSGRHRGQARAVVGPPCREQLMTYRSRSLY